MGIEERYDAFISYNHAADGELAPAIERGLQRLAKPWYKLRALSIFRDMSDTGLNPSLWGTVQRQLDRSRWLILLASPGSAGSQWVSREVAHWADTKGAATILLVLTEGELVWDRDAGAFDLSRTTALHPDLAPRFTSEPLYLDLRWARAAVPPPTLADARFRSDMARLASPIRDMDPEEIESEDVRLYRTARRLARGAIAALVTLAIVASVAAVIAVRNAQEAERRAREATARQLGLLALDMPASELDRALLVSAAAAELDPTGSAERFRPARELLGRHSRLTAMLHVPGDLPQPSLRGVAISPDGRVVAATAWSESDAPHLVRWDRPHGDVEISDLAQGDRAAVALGADGAPVTFGGNTVAVDDAGRRSFVFDGGNVVLIDPSDREMVGTWPSGEDGVVAAITGDRSALVVGSVVRLIDATSGSVLAEGELAAAAVAVAVRDDTVVTASEAGALTWWQRSDDGLAGARTTVVPGLGRPSAVVLDGTGDVALVAGEAATAVVDGRAARVVATDPVAGSVAIDPSGRFAAVGGSRVTIWDLARAERVVAVAEEVNALAWSACDGTGPCRLVTAGEAIIVWEPDSGRRVELADQTNAQAVDITDDGETIASAGWGTSVALWDMSVPIDDSSREQLTEAGSGVVAYDEVNAAFVRARSGAATEVTVGDDTVSLASEPVVAARLAAGATRLFVEVESGLRLYDVVDRGEIALACEGDEWAISPRATRLATYRRADDTVMVCDLASGTRLAVGRFTGAGAEAIAVDDDGAVALGGGGLVGYYGVDEGRFRPGVSVDVRFGGELADIGPIALRGGRIAAAVDPRSGAGRSRVAIWDAAARAIAIQFETDHPDVAAVALLGDDAEMLAVGGRSRPGGDVVIEVWESESRRRLGRGLGGLVGDVIALGGDESSLTATDGDGRTFRWRLDRDPSREVCEIVGRDLTEEEWSALTTYRYEPVCAGR